MLRSPLTENGAANAATVDCLVRSSRGNKMKTYEECFPCFERQASEACALCAMSPETTAEVLESVRTRMCAFPPTHSPVEMAAEIHEVVRAAADQRDPYRAIKDQSNRACRESMNVLSECMAWSIDPFETAAKLAIAGNVIDFGVYSPNNLCKRDVIQSAQRIIGEALCGESLAEFKALAGQAERILYVGDNAGECFLDTFLLDQLPHDTVRYAVRGGAVLNDATTEDAEAAGIHKRCHIVDTGDNAPGVLLERCSAEFQRVFDEADLVIAKGQGNYESLSETPAKTCVFLAKVKCPVIGRDIGYPTGSNVIRIIKGESRKAETMTKAAMEVCHA